MDGAERKFQIIQAATEYLAASMEATYIERRIEHVFDAYKRVGASFSREIDVDDEPKIVDGRVQFGSPPFGYQAADLLNGEDLLKLLQRRDEAREQLRAAKLELDKVGNAVTT